MKKPAGYALIGEGDDFVEEWHYGFEDIDDGLSQYLHEAEEFEFKINWKSIIQSVYGHARVRRNFQPYTTIDLYQEINVFDIDHEEWGGELPGRGGFYFTITARRDQIKDIKKSLKNLLKALDKYWINEGFRLIVAENNYNQLERNYDELRRTNVRQDIELTRLTDKFKIDDRAEQGFMRLKEDLIPILTYIFKPKDLFFSMGPILATRAGDIFAITNHSQFYEFSYEHYAEVLTFLKNIKLDIIEVAECKPDGSSFGHTPVFARDGLKGNRGWNQAKTYLRSAKRNSIDVNKVRDDYLKWREDNPISGPIS